jgi:Fe-S oxidoreductase
MSDLKNLKEIAGKCVRCGICQSVCPVNRCCGMAGIFNFVYYDLSKKILKRKLDDIESTRADVVATSCMGCLIQLKDGIHQRAMSTRALHLVEVLEKGNLL